MTAAMWGELEVPTHLRHSTIRCRSRKAVTPAPSLRVEPNHLRVARFAFLVFADLLIIGDARSAIDGYDVKAHQSQRLGDARATCQAMTAGATLLMMLAATPIEFRLPGLVTEDWVLQSFGSVQSELRGAEGGAVWIDFHGVTWIDPLAILSVVAELDHCLSHGYVGLATFDLGEWGTSDEALLLGRTRKFLASIGLFHCLARLRGKVEIVYTGAADECARVVDAQDARAIDILSRELLSARSAPLVSEDVILVPMTLVRQHETTGATVDGLIQVANATYFRGSRQRLAARDSTLQRLRAVLDELVRNALEHGYHGEGFQNESTSVFVRVRRPHFGVPPADGSSGLRGRRRSLPGDGYMENIEGVERIELYVCDVGRGALADVGVWRDNALKGRGIGEAERTALKNATHEEARVKLLFRFPVSRFSRPDANAIERLLRGQTTGLVYLDKVLGYPGDLSCLHTGNVRVIGRHRFDGGGGSTHERRKEGEGVPVAGTLFRITLRVHNPTQLPSGWFVPEKNPTACADLVAAITRRGVSGGDEPEIIDLRSKRELNLTREVRVQTLFSERNVIVRLSRSAGKNELMNVLEKWLSAPGSSRTVAGGRLLVVTDMSRSQARNLQTALLGPSDAESPVLPGMENALPAKRQGRLLGTVMLVTEDLAVAVFEVRSTPKGRQPYTLYQYPVAQQDDAAPSVRERFRERIIWLLDALTRDDSLAFWKLVVEKTADGQALVLGPVKWWTVGSEYQTLPIYLDFRAALQERDLARIVRKALRRVLALFPGGHFIAIDTLVEGELRDAMRWSQSDTVFDSDTSQPDLLEKVLQDSRLVLVGSVGVSGATRDRFVKGSLTDAPFLVECFHREGSRDSTNRQLSALYWIEETELDYRAVLKSPPGLTYERERETPYVRRVNASTPLWPSVVSFEALGVEPKRQWPSETYAAFERDNLLRMGHWQFGGRHSLLEANTPLAVDHFVASGRGFFPWLLKVVTQCCEDGKGDWVVVYPAHRSVDKIVRVLRADIENARLGILPSFLPLQLIAGVGGGINRLSDLSLARLAAIRSHQSAGRSLSAIFVDVGFIDKRTLREVRRQLAAVGVPVVRAFAVNNRSNSPAFPAEDDTRAVQGYWRWNVPILGHPDQCTLCSGLRSLGYLSQGIRTRRRDLLRTLNTVLRLWKVSSLQDEWWEEGVEPYRLPAPIELRMGYTEDRLFERHPDFRSRMSSPEVFWHVVRHEYSVGVLSHYIELSRYTGKGTLLLEKIRDKSELAALPPLALVECIAGYLAICGLTLPHWQRVAYVEELIRQLFRHLALSASWKVGSDQTESAQRTKEVLGLATLVAMNLDKRTKLACGDGTWSALRDYLVHPSLEGRHAAIGPEARLLLVALDVQTEEHGRRPPRFAPTADLFGERLLVKRISEVLDSVSLVTRTRRSLWAAFDDRLGSRDIHDGQIARSLRATNGRDAASACYALASLLGGATPTFLTALDFDETSADTLIDAIGALGDEVIRAEGSDLAQTVQRAEKHLDLVRRKYQGKLLRCAESEDNIATTFDRWFRTSGAFARNEDPFMSDPRDVAFVRVAGRWSDGTHYLPMCRHLQERIVDTIRNAIRNAVEPFASAEADGDLVARVWIDVKQTDSGVLLTIVNRTTAGKTLGLMDIPADCLDEIGGKMQRLIDADSGHVRYEVRMNIPWLETISRDEKEVTE